MAGLLRNDLTGKTFTHLFVIRRSSQTGSGKKPVVLFDCRCVCGKITTVKSYSLTSGHTKSCGCKKIKHGYAHKERLYETWKNMRRRCLDPKNKRWDQYGGKGITVCKEWLNNYMPFRNWAMDNGYQDNLTIDRKDSNGNYEPDNCRWTDAKTQMNNVSRNRIFEYDGKKMTMSELAEYLRISYSTLQHRVDNGWDMDRIVSTPQRRMTS